MPARHESRLFTASYLSDEALLLLGGRQHLDLALEGLEDHAAPRLLRPSQALAPRKQAASHDTSQTRFESRD